MTNFDFISFFSLRSPRTQISSISHSSEFVPTSVSDLQNPTRTHAAGAQRRAHRGTRLSAANTITMNNVTITMSQRAEDGETVLGLQANSPPSDHASEK